MKTEILNYLNQDRSFKTGRELYMKHGNKMGFKRVLNSRPEDKELLETLLHELAQMAEIDNKMFAMIMNRPLIKQTQETAPVEKQQEEMPSEELMAEKKTVITNMKAVLKLREEFPFLSDAKCPDEFKILVADKTTAYYKFKEAHAKLFTAEDEDQLLQANIDVVENVIENQEIYDELDHYKKTGEILGKHAIFQRADLREKYLTMDTPGLIMARENCKKRISALNTEIAKNKKPEKLHEKQDNLTLKEEELDILNKLLGFKDQDKPVKKTTQKATAVKTDKKEVTKKAGKKKNV